MSKIALRSLLLCCLAVPIPTAAFSSPQEAVAASLLTLLNRVVGIATQVTQDDDAGYRVRVLRLYPLGENGTDDNQEISGILAAEPAALFVSNPGEPDAFVGVALDRGTITGDAAWWRLESARRDLVDSLDLADNRQVYVATMNSVPDIEPSFSVVSYRFPDRE